jgi:hypothetical protein
MPLAEPQARVEEVLDRDLIWALFLKDRATTRLISQFSLHFPVCNLPFQILLYLSFFFSTSES